MESHTKRRTVQVTGLSLEEYEFSVRDSDFLGSFIGVGYQPTGWAGITGIFRFKIIFLNCI